MMEVRQLNATLKMIEKRGAMPKIYNQLSAPLSRPPRYILTLVLIGMLDECDCKGVDLRLGIFLTFIALCI